MAKIASISVISAFFMYMVASPYVTAYQIRAEIQKKDSASLVERIDFPKVRESLKSMNHQLLLQLHQPSHHSVLQNILGSVTTKYVLNRLIEHMVTPDNFAMAMSASGGVGDSIQKISKQRAVLHYADWDRFVISAPRGSAGNIQLVMKRDWFSWKVVAVQWIPALDKQVDDTDE